MRRHLWIIPLILAALLLLTACGTAPVEESLPTETPLPTAPPATATIPPTAPPSDETAPGPPVVAEKETFLDYEGVHYDAGPTDALYPGPEPGRRWLPALGAEDAPVTVIEFSEIMCGYCRMFALEHMEPILHDYVASGDVRYVGHYMAFNQEASIAYIQASFCAAEQGRYFAFEHAVFEGLGQNEFDLEQSANRAGVDMDTLIECWDSGRYHDAIMDAVNNAGQQGINATPAFLINGQLVTGNQPDEVRRLVEAALSGSPPEEGDTMSTTNGRNGMYDAPPAMGIDPEKEYIATIVTEKGDIVIELFADKVPNTVNNFVFLAREGFYDATMFHRVIEGFMAQAGDPTGTGTGGPGYRFEDEFHPDLKHDAPGILSMANAGPGTNGSQFFITFEATPWLDGRHAVFGKVADEASLDVLRSISIRDPQTATTPGDAIETITITEQ